MDFEKELQMATAAAEETIENFLPTEVSFQKPVTDAMNYSVLSGGKRIRPILMAETYKLFALPWEDEKGRTVQIPQNPVLHRFMAGIEFIHNYSLVHDDLPAMDNDDMRRGQETTHKKFGEALGILAGDALLNYAFEMMAKGFETDRICEACMLLGRTNEAEYMKRVAWALLLTAQKAGIHGMIGGQTADVCDEGKDIGKDELLFIYEARRRYPQGSDRDRRQRGHEEYVWIKGELCEHDDKQLTTDIAVIRAGYVSVSAINVLPEDSGVNILF